MRRMNEIAPRPLAEQLQLFDPGPRRCPKCQKLLVRVTEFWREEWGGQRWECAHGCTSMIIGEHVEER